MNHETPHTHNETFNTHEHVPKVSILVLGDLEGECGEWQDRDSLDLAGGQLQVRTHSQSVYQWY
jgi:hypothetical protein